jgi:hypothetical protein
MIVSAVAGAAFLAILLILLVTPVAGNLWLLLIEPLYVIPRESSISTFEPTVMNPGSGDWWIYGEDKSHFYYFTGESPSLYVMYPKKLAAQCVGFQPINYETWCHMKGHQ